jgi:iron complex transport system substrate-binding protein
VIYALGTWEKVVGVTIYDDFPPEAKELPKIGGWINPNYEAIILLKPDLVVLMKDQDTIFGEKIRDLGLKTYVIDSNDSISDILKSISDLGSVLNKNQEATILRNNIETNLNKIKELTKDSQKKKVLIVVGRSPGTLEDIYVIGRDNYINELLTIAGGENVVENKRLSIKITQEAILYFDPDVIVEVNHEKLNRESEILNTWANLKLAKAVRNNQVFILSSSFLLHPSQRIVDGARVLAETLHPELKEKYGNNN